MKRIKIKNKDCFFDEDLESEIEKHTWRLSSNGYAIADVRNGSNRGTLRMHHIVLNKKNGLDTDHINGNKLDNRLKNLRRVTRSQNNMNKRVKGYRKTHWGAWQAYIKKAGKNIHLGTFKTAKDAKIARRNAEIKYFGEYAKK